jgi:signal peptidase I
MPKAKTKSKAFHFSVTLALVVSAVFLLQTFVVQIFWIPSESMASTLVKGQVIFVDKISHGAKHPKVGDIVVFHPPADWNSGRCAAPISPAAACSRSSNTKSETHFVKRVVGLPGDRIQIVNGHVVRNGVAQKDQYVQPCDSTATVPCHFPTEITVPDDHYFLMGDNRGKSGDSRFFGPIPTSAIVGKATGTIWPLDRIGLF